MGAKQTSGGKWPKAERLVWMAPALQGICEGWRVGRVQSCVRPVCAIMTAGPDGFRGRGPILLCGLRRPGHLRRVVLVPGPTGSPSLHMVLATSSRDTALIDKLVLRQLPSRAPASVDLAPDHNGPDC